MRVEEFDAVNMIVHCYDVMTKSNSIILITSMSFKNQRALSNKISKDKEAFQILFEIVMMTITSTNHRASLTSSTTSSKYSEIQYETADNEFKKMIVSTMNLVDLKNVKMKKEITITFRQFKSYLNIHIKLHFKVITIEYATLNNVNVLIEEDKHK